LLHSELVWLVACCGHTIRSGWSGVLEAWSGYMEKMHSIISQKRYGGRPHQKLSSATRIPAHCTSPCHLCNKQSNYIKS